MSEIHNNINNIRFKNIDPLDKKNAEPAKTTDKSADINKESNIVQDTGVLGRSQVRGTNAFDVTKSVDETILLAGKHPEIISAGDELFERIYQRFIDEGIDESTAYALAAMGLEEFAEMGSAHLQH